MKPGASGSLTVAASASSAVLCGQMRPVPTIPHHQWSPACEDGTVRTWLKSHLFSRGPGLTTSWLDSSRKSPDCKERTRLFCLAVVKHGWTLYFQEDISVLFMVSKSMNFLIFPLKTKQNRIPCRPVKKHEACVFYASSREKGTWESPVIENWRKKCKCNWHVEEPPWCHVFIFKMQLLYFKQIL